MNKKVATKLKRIITVSLNSKKDIALDFKIDPKRVDVIPNGLDLKVFKKKNGLERERFVGLSEGLVTLWVFMLPTNSSIHFVR